MKLLKAARNVFVILAGSSLVLGLVGLIVSVVTDMSFLEAMSNVAGPPLVVVGLAPVFYWVYMGWKGVWLLYKKGHIFPNGIGAGTILVFLIVGWPILLIVWEIVGLGGLFFYNYAKNKPEKPVCEACKRRNELNATRCSYCTAYIQLAPSPV